MPKPLPDSGKRQEFNTGSVRDERIGKGRFDLLPARAIKRIARRFEDGAIKYGDRNWEKGQPVSRYIDSGLRHAFAFLEGKADEDHLAAAAWNFLCAIDTEDRVNESALPLSLADIKSTTSPTESHAKGSLLND